MNKKIIIPLALVGLLLLGSMTSEAATLDDESGGADVDYRNQSGLPRGMRNNNPLNIKHNSANNWQGQVGSDGVFVIFESYKYGIRAAMRLLINYMKNYNLRTVRGIVNKWAPPGTNENNPTSVYANFVAEGMEVSPDETLELNYYDIALLTMYMANFENGKPCVTGGQTKQVWDEFFKSEIGRLPAVRLTGARNSYMVI